MSTFEAQVVDIREERRVLGRIRWQVLLDRTSFSPGDSGTLQAVARSGARLVIPVLEVQRDANGEVWHIIEKPLAAETVVTGRVGG